MASLKTLVGISNIIMYSAFVLVFLGFGYTNLISPKISIILEYILLFLSILFLFLYWKLRKQHLKITKYKYQFTKQDQIFIKIFYLTSGLFFLTLLFYILGGQLTWWHGKTVRLLFFILFPIIFVVAFTVSVLESITRVREQIYIHQQNMSASQKWEVTEKKNNSSLNPKPKN